MGYIILSLGGSEIVLVFLAFLLLFGSSKIPEVAKGLGKGLREFKKATDDIKREINEHTGDMTKDITESANSIKKNITEITSDLTSDLNESASQVNKDINEITSNLGT